jgi:hypothetical protein
VYILIIEIPKYWRIHAVLHSSIMELQITPSNSGTLNELGIFEIQIKGLEEIQEGSTKYQNNLFLALPPEILLKIVALLNPIDATCLSLVRYVTPRI